jgi:peptidyl-prolyl cis-trans isomerase SurA
MDKATADKVIEYLASDTMDYAKIQAAINTTSELTLIIKRNTFNSETTDWMKIEKKAKPASADADPCKKTKAAKPAKIRTFKMGTNKVFIYKDEYYVFDVEEIMTPRVREFAEAKGLVTAAYQTELETKWLQDLRTKYTIVINNDVLYSLSE